MEHRAPERRRVRLWNFLQWVLEGNLPRPAPRQRPGPAFGLVLLGDPPSFEDDSDPHVCVMPCDAVAVPSLAATPACLATWAGGLLFGADGVARLRFRHARGCLPRPRDRLARHDRSGFDQGLLLSRRAPRVVRRSREAAALPCPDVTYSHFLRPGASVDPPLQPEMRRHGASVPTGCIPPCDPRYWRIGIAWHLGVGGHKL